ncbi:TlpA family protein disulfide reductase [Dyadobacter sp. LJ53]|uniref:TlpA family protein disulfide reductase n=1 Tax=Dyadobacter chenwenxiniae TaxID=2906456 RepID=UPI001F1A5E08|nr:TlpA disulfide reductase family protein [Dyadobacter chenwenxiniae]MCF0052508.1 TlpA family protein disulfide reductase [Dyadobacter chenwenxiniae]
MKTIVFSIIAYFVFLSGFAQTSHLPNLSPGDYFNNFQKFTNESPDADAAFTNAQKLASNPAYENLATELIHNSFAQSFIYYKADSARLQMQAKRRVLATEILSKMILDSSALVRGQVKPLFYLTKVQEAAHDPGQLSKLTKEFIDSEVDGKDIYRYRSGRYGLLILGTLDQHAELKSLSGLLTDKLATQLRAGQVVVTDSTSRADLDKRAWYRFMNAYVNFLKSQQTNDRQQKETLLKTAFEYSPDLVDKNHKGGYFYDMHMLLGREKDGFQDEYLTFLTQNEDKKHMLATLLSMSLVDPDFKEKLVAAHKEVMPGDNFAKYWKDAVDASAVKSPPINLAVLGSKPFSSESLSGQWILVDFWGTWCGPCRQEHPDLQKFYKSTVTDKTKNLSVLTVACKDTEAKVLAYMSKNNYDFPVALADKGVEKSFKVQGYPTKILITPTGKYVTVPYGVDWVSFVNNYVQVD